MYDHSVRVPFMVVGPGIKAGAKNGAPIYLQDVMPTTLELAGQPIPEYVEFKSLMPMLKQGESKHYESIYGAYKGVQRMVVQNGWKLIHYPTIGVDRLYNMKADPEEMTDLALNPEYATKIKELRGELDMLRTSFNDPLDYADATASWKILNSKKH